MAGPVASGAQEFEAKLAAFVKDNRLYGAAAGVVHDDELAWSGGAGFADAAARKPAMAQTLYRIASITKTFTGTAIMQLRDAGKLDLDDQIVNWIPELAASADPAKINAVTLRRLLSHESGLKSEPPGADWMQPVVAYEGAVERNLERVAEIFAAVPANVQTKYSNLGYQLLGEVVHRASGTEYPDYVEQAILEPLGMSSTSFEPLGQALADRCATGYNGRIFSDELDVAPAMPQLWAEGGLWSDTHDLAKWLSFQLAAHAAKPVESPVLATATRREMHSPRYLGDDAWISAFGISWYGVRKDDVIWIQHSGGLPGFITNACFERKSRVGAIVLLNGVGNASDLAMALAGIARRLVQASPPPIVPPAPAPKQVRSLLGLYAPADMSEIVRLEWRDGKLVFVSMQDPAWQPELEPADDPDTFMVAPGLRQSGERVQFRRLPDGQVASAVMGSGTLLRLDLVAANDLARAAASGEAWPVGTA
jgi:CubicO group peptidase (beta-lactamase class C family)